MNPASPTTLGAIFVSLLLSLCLHLFAFQALSRLDVSRQSPVPRSALKAALKTRAPAEIPESFPELRLDVPEQAIVAESVQTGQTPQPPARDGQRIFAVPPISADLPPERPAEEVSAANPQERLRRSVARQLEEMDRQGAFYPLEAIRRGLEGEVLIRVFLDENGNVIAARTEQGSGILLLDQAAEKAARALKGLPADGAGDVLLPVRFRLKE